MDPFAKVAIGSTGVSVTRLGLGGGPLVGGALASQRYETPREEGLRIIRRAFDLGVRYFDTAPLYGAGRSEARYGAVLPSFPRSSFALSSKCGRVLELAAAADSSPTEDGVPRLKPVFDLSRDGILQSLEASLKRLHLDSVDILYLHDPDVENLEREAMDSAFPAMVELREQGVVKAIGCGMNQWQMPARFIRAFQLDIVLLAGRFTLLDHDAYREFLPLCLERGVKLTIGGPYNSGILARDLDGPVSFNYAPAPQELIHQARQLKQVCDRYGVPLKAAALQYVLNHPVVATAIPGARSVAELEDNVRMVETPIPVELWAEMKHEGLIPADAPVGS